MGIYLNGSNISAEIWVNVDTGTVGQVTQATPFVSSITVTADGTGWFDLSFKMTTITTSTSVIFYLGLASADGTNVYVGSASENGYWNKASLTLASTTDQSYQRVTDWTTEQYAWAAQKNVPWLRRNRFLNTATLSTQTVSSVTATPLTVSITGTGKIDFTTAYTGTLQGTGASDRVTATFTPTAGNLVCTVTGTVTLAQCEVGSTATPYQEVGASWAATYTALAKAAGYPISLYSDRAGTTATVGPDDPVGVLLDQSEGLALGPELVTNGGFTTDTGWIYGAEWSISNGVATHSGPPSYVIQSGFTATAGSYLITFDVSGNTNAAAFSFDNYGAFPSGGYFSAMVSGTYRLIAYTSGGTGIRIYAGNNFNGSVDNVSIRKIPGYHATAPSDAARPVLKLDGNGRWYLDRDTTDDNLPITWPTVLSESQLGPELVSNGTFTTDTTGWAAGASATLSSASGQLRVTNGGAAYGYAYQTTPTAVGKTYLVTITRSNGNAGANGYRIGTTSQGLEYASESSATVTQVTKFVTATSSTLYLTLYCWSSTTTGVYCDYDNISVREVTGTNVIYTATGDYTTKDSGLILSGATDYKFPQRPSGDYGRIVMAAESKYDAKIIKYLDQKRGRSYQLGPELVTNGSPLVDGSWTKSAEASVVGGQAVLTAAPSGNGIWQVLSGASASAKSYLVTYSILAVTTGTVRMYSGSGAPRIIRSSPGTYSEVCSFISNNMIYILSATSNTTATVGNISVREILL
jgi:hypothetical protein